MTTAFITMASVIFVANVMALKDEKTVDDIDVQHFAELKDFA